ncbi:MAG: PilN domain-containing protein [Candidatus Aminicenantes bacterium]|nr:PilN domain-containing protein [Candidatus Aminicenantes bacterium]MCK5003771.1 PilN domain-containing protein [Candidatus Aminicenantes bacterium]
MIKVNLLSPEKKDLAPGLAATESFADEAREQQVSVPAIIGALVLTVFIIGGMYFLQANKLSDVKKFLEVRKARLTELEDVLQTLKVLENTKKVLKNKVDIIQSLNARKQVAVKMMDQLSRALPEMVWLNNMKFNNRTLSLKGSALSNNLVADFINNLKSTNYFNNIKFKDSVRKKKSGVDVFDFRLDCTFSDPTKKKGTV